MWRALLLLSTLVLGITSVHANWSNFKSNVKETAAVGLEGYEMGKVGDTLYLFGRPTDNNIQDNKMWKHDAVADEWVVIPPSPTQDDTQVPPKKLVKAKMVTTSTHIYVFQGSYTTLIQGVIALVTNIHTFQYDPATNEWSIHSASDSEKFADPMEDFCVANSETKIWMYGGFKGGSESPLNEFWEYDIPSRKWSEKAVTGGPRDPVTKWPFPLYDCVLVHNPDLNRLHLMGGRGGESAYDSNCIISHKHSMFPVYYRTQPLTFGPTKTVNVTGLSVNDDTPLTDNTRTIEEVYEEMDVRTSRQYDLLPKEPITNPDDSEYIGVPPETDRPFHSPQCTHWTYHLSTSSWELHNNTNPYFADDSFAGYYKGKVVIWASPPTVFAFASYDPVTHQWGTLPVWADDADLPPVQFGAVNGFIDVATDTMYVAASGKDTKILFSEFDFNTCYNSTCNCVMGQCTDCPAETDTIGYYPDCTPYRKWCACDERGDCRDLSGKCSCRIGSVGENCTMCPVGHKSSLEDCPLPRLNCGECTPCPSGTIAAIQGSGECAKCGKGHYSQDATRCVGCALGEYQDETGSEGCKQCPPQSRTCGVISFGPQKILDYKCVERASSVENCKCKLGYYGNGATGCKACPPGGDCCSCPEIGKCVDTTLDTNESCNGDLVRHNLEVYGRACSKCDGGVVNPVALRGYFAASSPDGEPVFLPCTPADSCRGGSGNATTVTCAVGYTGRRCGECDTLGDPMYYRTSAGCKVCPDSAGWILVVTTFAVGIGIMYCLRTVSQYFRSGSITILIDFIQTLQLFEHFLLNWPDEVITVFDVTSIANFDIGLIAPECNLQLDRWGQDGLYFSIPLIVGALYAGYFAVKIHKLVDPVKRRKLGNVVVNAFLLILSLTHASLLQHSLKLFRCAQMADGEYYVDSLPYVVCYGDVWWDHVSVYILALIVYGVGIPTLFGVILYRVRDRLTDRDAKQRYGSIFIVYNYDHYYFDLWYKLKKTLLLIALNMFQGQRALQTVVGIVVLLISVSLCTRRIFRYDPNNLLNYRCQAGLMALFTTGLIFFNTSIKSGVTITVTVLFMIIFSFTCIVLGRAIIHEILVYYGISISNMHPILKSILKHPYTKRIFKSNVAFKRVHWAHGEQTREIHHELSRVNSIASEVLPREDSNNTLSADDERNLFEDTTVDAFSLDTDAVVKSMLGSREPYRLYKRWKQDAPEVKVKDFAYLTKSILQHYYEQRMLQDVVKHVDEQEDAPNDPLSSQVNALARRLIVAEDRMTDHMLNLGLNNQEEDENDTTTLFPANSSIYDTTEAASDTETQRTVTERRT
eukprot:GFYU01001447.1.p1 GENE.GFYU01001447.1~~GFYU01001447.1.p1  ORF type:complete len:1320 (-),score=331.99 GFYU01001447.1:109-4068(-)